LQAAVLGVPFVDALTTERDPTLPLTVGEWEEWGAVPLDAPLVVMLLLKAMLLRMEQLAQHMQGCCQVCLEHNATSTGRIKFPAGDPLHNKTAYEYMKSYSPYDNVKAQPYPHMLVTAGLSDPRVSYWEVRHAVARGLDACGVCAVSSS
jgi:Prolyl oligopeptidase family